MSDEWIFYPSQMGDDSASTFYDHGIRETIHEITAPQLLKVQVQLKSPNSSGLSSQAEYQQLCDLEDDLQGVVERHGGVYVGRITVGGERFLYYYGEGSEADWSERLAETGERHGYPLSFLLERDEARDGYWKELFPTDDDWQVVLDLRVLENLTENGDELTTRRRIDHWAYFPSAEIAGQFFQWAAAQGYLMEDLTDMEDGQFRVCFAHEGAAKLGDITSHTIALGQKAREMSGQYDGWETVVCKPRL